MDKKKVLIITHSKDNECINNVSHHIAAAGGEAIRFDVDRYPTDSRLSSIFQNNNRQILLECDGKTHALHDVVSVWFRRAYNIGRGLDETLVKEYIPSVKGEVRQTVLGMVEGLDCFKLARPSTYRRLDSKEEQLKIAVECGLNIPATCISNDPHRIKAFIKSVGSEVITKMQSSFAIYREGVEHVVFTNTVTEKDLQELDTVQNCPMVFQQKIEKQLELRVTIVGDQLFTFSIDSQKEMHAKVDWRKEGRKLINDWKPYELPDNIKNSLLLLMNRFGLHYGAVDLILTPDDQYYFLEINSAGEYFWLDRLCDHAISKQIAHVLLTH